MWEMELPPAPGVFLPLFRASVGFQTSHLIIRNVQGGLNKIRDPTKWPPVRVTPTRKDDHRPAS